MECLLLYPEASKRGNDRIISWNYIRTKEGYQPSVSASVPPSGPPTGTLLSELPGSDTISFLLPAPPPPAAPLSPAKEDKKSEVIIAPFNEKPITGRDESSSVFTYTPSTQTELRSLPKEFPDPSQDPWGIAKEFELTIQTYEQGFSDLYLLIQLLVLKAKKGNG